MVQMVPLDEWWWRYGPAKLRRLSLWPMLLSTLVFASFTHAQEMTDMEFSQHPFFLQMAKRVYGDSANTPVWTYRVVSAFPHDPNAFTQGLAFESGFLYEGTGLHGASTLREVALETGDIVRIHGLDDRYFGEGITVWRSRIIQLTWTANLGFIYDRDSFDLIQEFRYPFEGWGITHDDECLIISDGSPRLYFVDGETLRRTRDLEVYDRQGPLYGLNELEYVGGQIFANVWPTEFLARIDPVSGRVVGWIDLRGILTPEDRGDHRIDVLNGTAYDAIGNRLFVTGKWWPRLYEIDLVKAEKEP